GFQQVHTVAPGGLSQIPNVPREGTQLMELGSATEWQITAGARFPLPSPEVRDALIGAGALEATPYIVPLGSLAQIPTTPHDGARVRELSSGGVDFGGGDSSPAGRAGGHSRGAARGDAASGGKWHHAFRDALRQSVSHPG